MRNPTTPTEALAILRDLIDAGPQRDAPEVYDGPTPDECDGWSRRDLDGLADRRADQMLGGS